MSNAADIEAIQARLDAATPGPWRQNPGHATIWTEAGVPIAETYIHQPPTRQELVNAEFIAHAPQDIADLLHERGNVEQRAGLVDEILARNEALQAALTRSEQLAAERAEQIEIMQPYLDRYARVGPAIEAVVEEMRFLRDRYHCRVTDPTLDLADTDEEAERIFEASQATDEEVYQSIVAALAAYDAAREGK